MVQFSKRIRNMGLTLTLGLSLGILVPAIHPPIAEAACFFWQACARQRGQASNTRAGGKRTGRIIGGNDASIPYVISPRNTWIQAPSSTVPYTISWSPVAEATGYTVRLWQWTFERDHPDRILWETTVDEGSQIPFPTTVSLEPGIYYSIEIVTDTGISSDLDAAYDESGFQLLFAEDYEALRSQLAEVTLVTPADTVSTEATTSTDENLIEDTVLAKAGIFFLEEMYADALTILQTLAERSSASELVYIALGDTYTQTGLNQLSIKAYTQALSLATHHNDLLSEATTRVKLADVYATVGLFENALQQLREARSAYAQIQETTEITRLDRRIEILDSRLSRQNNAPSTP